MRPLVPSLRRLRSSSSWESGAGKIKIKDLLLYGFNLKWTNLCLNVIRWSVNLKLSIEGWLRRLVTDNIEVNRVIVHQRPFPSQQDSAVLLTSEIRDGWRCGGSNVSFLKNSIFSLYCRCGESVKLTWMRGVEALPSCLVVMATTTILYSLKGPAEENQRVS